MSSWQLDFGSDDFVLPDTRKKRPRNRQESLSSRMGPRGSGNAVSKPRPRLDFYQGSRASSVDGWRFGGISDGRSSVSGACAFPSEKENRSSKYRSVLASPIPEEEFECEKCTKTDSKYRMLKAAFEKQRSELDRIRERAEHTSKQNESLLTIVAQLRRENEEGRKEREELVSENQRMKDERKQQQRQGLWEFDDHSRSSHHHRASLDQSAAEQASSAWPHRRGFGRPSSAAASSASSSSLESNGAAKRQKSSMLVTNNEYRNKDDDDFKQPTQRNKYTVDRLGFSKKNRDRYGRTGFGLTGSLMKEEENEEEQQPLHSESNSRDDRYNLKKRGIRNSKTTKVSKLTSHAEITLSGALDDSGLMLDHERQREEKRRQRHNNSIHTRGFDDDNSLGFAKNGSGSSSMMFGHRRRNHHRTSLVSDPFRLDTPPELASRLPRPPPPPKTPLFNFDTVQKKKRSIFGLSKGRLDRRRTANADNRDDSHTNNHNNNHNNHHHKSGASSETRDHFAVGFHQLREDRSRGTNTAASRRSRSTRELSRDGSGDSLMTDRSSGATATITSTNRNSHHSAGFFFGRPQQQVSSSLSSRLNEKDVINEDEFVRQRRRFVMKDDGVMGGNMKKNRDDEHGSDEHVDLMYDDNNDTLGGEGALELSAFVCEVSHRLDMLRADILGEPDGVAQLVCCLTELSKTKEDDWKRRSFLMKLASAVAREAKPGSLNAMEVQRFTPVVQRQLSDARSAIIREACGMVSSLCIACDRRFVDGCLVRWLPLMFDGLAKTSTAVIRDAHSRALHACIEDCDWSLQSRKILPMIVRRLNNERRTDGHSGVRAECVSLLCCFVTTKGIGGGGGSSSLDNNGVSKRLSVIAQCIHDCSTDPSQIVRQQCRRLFEIFVRAYPRCLIEGILRSSSTIEKWRRQLR